MVWPGVQVKRLSQLVHDWMRLNIRTTSKFILNRNKDAGIVAKEKVHVQCTHDCIAPHSNRCATQTPRIKRCVLSLYASIARLNASVVRLRDHIARHIVRPCDWLYDHAFHRKSVHARVGDYIPDSFDAIT